MRTLTLLLAIVSTATAHAAHPVFDLVANRTLAHVERDGALSLAAGSPGFARYVHFSRPLPTWKLRQSEDGKRVALAQTQAVLEVPLTAAEAQAGVVTMRLKSPVKQTVRATARGKSSPAVPLTDGWQTVQLTLPAGALADGENKITLAFANSGHFGDRKASAAVEWIDIGTASKATDAPTIFDGNALVVPANGALVYYVMVPAGGALALDAPGCNLKVTPSDLSARGDKVVRLSLASTGAACAIKSAALTAGGDAPTVKHAPAPKNVVFWLTDDTRSDKFKLYNPKTRVETPVIDAFAKRATLFKVAYVQGNESRVSHASLWTSLYPLNHHFIAEKAKLDPKFVTMPEAVKPTGALTVGLMGNGFIDAFWGFGEGWDVLKNHIHEGGGLKAEDFVVEAKQMLQKYAVKPFFMYIGTIDAHVSWRAHLPWIAKYDPEPYTGPFVKACLDPQLDKIVAGKMHDHRSRQDAHRGALRFGRQLQRSAVRQAPRASCNADDTMIIFTADHGEELWDHGRIGHGQSLREELVHVPLLISYPPLFPAGQDGRRGRRDHRPHADDRRRARRQGAGRRAGRVAHRRWRRARAPAIRARPSPASTSWRTRCASGAGSCGWAARARCKLFDAGERRAPRRTSCRPSGRSSAASSPTRWACGWPIRRSGRSRAGAWRRTTRRSSRATSRSSYGGGGGGQPLPADDLVGIGAHERRQPADLAVAAPRVEAPRAVVPVRHEQEQVARARRHVALDGVEQRATDAAALVAGGERDEAQVAADGEVPASRNQAKPRAAPSSSTTRTGSPRPIASANSCANRVDVIS